MSHLFAPILLDNSKRVDHPNVLVQPEKQARTQKALEGIKKQGWLQVCPDASEVVTLGTCPWLT